ncbi:MAG: GNAT family N-acetyltransferase [Candidatus Shapirobacteria bacterium]
MANVDIKVFENIYPKEKIIFDKFISDNWDEPLDVNNQDNFDIPRLWIVGYRNNRIVGLFLIYDREIIFENQKIKMAGLGGVVTRVDCRRTGVMSQILQKFFTQFLPKYKFDIGLLCTDIKKIGKLFGRVGFVPLNRSYFFIDKNGVEKEETGGMIMNLNTKKLGSKILGSKAKLFVGKSNF